MKKFNDLPPRSKSREDQNRRDSFRVSIAFTIPERPGVEKVCSKLYNTMEGAEWAFRTSVLALGKSRHLDSWRAALNRVESPPWKDPIYFDSGKKIPKPPKPKYQEWKKGED